MKKKFNDSIKNIVQLFKNITFDKNFEYLCKKSIVAINNNRKIIFLGNGGSASDAQHLATELTCKFKKKRRALPALALTTDTSALTDIGNDYGFKYIFSRQIEAIGNKGDILIAITTSGNSLNLIEALKIAKRKKILTFCFSGNNGGKIKKVCEYSIIIPSKNADKIQVIELFLGQVLCGLIEDSL